MKETRGVESKDLTLGRKTCDQACKGENKVYGDGLGENAVCFLSALDLVFLWFCIFVLSDIY